MFKGRIRSHLTINHNESCLHRIVIESRMQGNCDELKILLKNHLIASRLNQELRTHKKNMIFIRISAREMQAV